MLSLAKPARLAAQAPSGYASLVTYGHRSWASTGEASGVLHMEGDMQPPRYHVGVIVAGMRAIMLFEFLAKQFDTSGKSPAYLHHRKSCKSPRRKRPRAFSFELLLLISRIGRRPHFTGAPSPQAAHRRKTRLKARCRPNLL